MKKIVLIALGALVIAGLLSIPLDLQVKQATAQVGSPVVETTAGTNRATKITRGVGVTAIHIEWTSTAGGAYTATLDNLSGTVSRVCFAPVAAASPTASYDVVVNDLAGVDVLEGEGANQSATAAADSVPLIAEVISSATTHNSVVTAGRLTLSITNAGASKQGEFTIYVTN